MKPQVKATHLIHKIIKVSNVDHFEAKIIALFVCDEILNNIPIWFFTRWYWKRVKKYLNKL
jgi:hypothetical protein|tara:strand:- start:127 stop:309 length:183 start_codon:yes stop_codon:yes gene_type:complete